MTNHLEFMECATCRAKSGSPTLCRSCLNNRRAIGTRDSEIRLIGPTVVGEVKTPIVKLPEGVPYMPGEEDYVITEDHTINDVIRWLVEQNDCATEIHMELEEIEKTIILN